MSAKNESEKTATLMSKLVADHEAAGGKLPAAAERKALIKAYEQARAGSAQASAAFKAAKALESKAAAVLVRAFGRRPVRLSSGAVVRPSGRGETVYYRGQSDPDDVVG